MCKRRAIQYLGNGKVALGRREADEIRAERLAVQSVRGLLIANVAMEPPNIYAYMKPKIKKRILD